MTDKEKRDVRDAMLFQAEMYLKIYMYFMKETKVNEMAYRLTSDFFKAQYEGIQKGSQPDPLQFLFFPKEEN